MTAQYYVTEFNKSLYDKEVMAQIFFIPSEAMLVRPNETLHSCNNKNENLICMHHHQTLPFTIYISIQCNTAKL